MPELAESTVHDPLTGLLTRMAVRELTRKAVERAASNETLVGKLHIDVDDFVLINDKYGYDVGDSILQALARRLTELVPPGGTAARLGGDAFAVLIENASSPQAVDELAHQVASTLAEPIPVNGGTVVCTVGVGVAATAGDASADDLVRHAEFALRAAKTTGTGNVRHYDESMHHDTKHRLELQSALERALEEKTLSLRYQPIVALDTGYTAGFEALLRWHHPPQGWISPELLVEIAEESGLIDPIGEWVVTTALNQVRDWDRLTPNAVPHVGVNVSAQQFRSSGFVQRIGGHLAARGLTSERLHLEITESLLLPDDERVLDDLQQLRRLGIRIAIDDFGKGYSALSYLRRVPLDVIKLDRLFTSSMAASTRQYELVKGIVGMARTLDLSVVAEGVETADDRDLAASAGCTFGQGYFFAEPLAADQVPDWLAGERDRVVSAGS